jgi:hypothetical protein
VYVLSVEELVRRLGDASPIYYLPQMREFNHSVTGIDLESMCAKPLLTEGQNDSETREGSPADLPDDEGVAPAVTGRCVEAD